jgi:hypothetical protein
MEMLPRNLWELMAVIKNDGPVSLAFSPICSKKLVRQAKQDGNRSKRKRKMKLLEGLLIFHKSQQECS